MWDFPLMNVASAMCFSGDPIQRIRIAVNAAAARPLRLKAVEDAVRGQPLEPPQPVRWQESWQCREPSRCSSTPTRFR